MGSAGYTHEKERWEEGSLAVCWLHSRRWDYPDVPLCWHPLAPKPAQGSAMLPGPGKFQLQHASTLGNNLLGIYLWPKRGSDTLRSGLLGKGTTEKTLHEPGDSVSSRGYTPPSLTHHQHRELSPVFQVPDL